MIEIEMRQGDFLEIGNSVDGFIICHLINVGGPREEDTRAHFYFECFDAEDYFERPLFLVIGNTTREYTVRDFTFQLAWKPMKNNRRCAIKTENTNIKVTKRSPYWNKLENV